MEQTPTSNVTKGIIIALIIMVLHIITFFSGFSIDGWTQYVIYAVFIAGIIASCIIYGKQMNGNVTFGNTFAHGFKVTAVVAVLMVAFFLLFTAVFPEVKEKMLETVKEKMSTDPRLTQDKIDQAMENSQKSFTVFMIAGTLFGNIFIGLLASLIGAAVTKRNPDSTIQQR